MWIAPSGYSIEQTKRLLYITTSWADRVISVYIRKTEAWYYFQSTIKKSLEYPLVAPTMTHKQFHSVESTALCSALKASGLPSNLQIYLVAGPQSFPGLNNGNIYGTQGRKHIYALMDHGYSKNTTGNHL